jgi:hypothetical protein
MTRCWSLVAAQFANYTEIYRKIALDDTSANKNDLSDDNDAQL